MTTEQFIAIQDRLDLSDVRLSETLGIHRRTVHNYRAGLNPVPKAIDYAMRYLLITRMKMAVHHILEVLPDEREKEIRIRVTA